jgi:hypothetical protein
MSDARMPRPGKVFTIAVGIPVTAITVVVVGLNWVSNAAHLAWINRQAQLAELAAQKAEHRRWMERLEDWDRGYVDGARDD